VQSNVGLNESQPSAGKWLLNVHKIIFRHLPEPFLHMWLLPFLFQTIIDI